MSITPTVYPYSYHTFIFPFLWNDSGKVTREKFETCIHPNWVRDYRKNAPLSPELYTQYAYFNQAARNAIFMEDGETDPIVRNYRFDWGKLGNAPEWMDAAKGTDNPVRYVIHKDDFEASLRVHSTRLRLYSTGMGMIVFELENYEFNDEKSINQINEFGRRIFKPFIDDVSNCSLCADTITLAYPGGTVESPINGVVPSENSDIRFLELILFLLRNGSKSAVNTAKPGPDQFSIEPIIDDRMFVSCLWANNDFALEMQSYTKDGYRYLADATGKEPSNPNNAAARLYQLIFVDGDGVSCRSRTMLRQMLDSHIYHRWLETSEKYATLTGMSEFSFVTVSSDPITIRAHLTEYNEMVMLVLAQRASLLSFERQISDCARGIRSINKIQSAYVHFQSKYLLREVTPQQQGIELYQMLCRHLYIDNLTRDVDGQIRALFSLAQNQTSWRNNVLFSTLTILNFAQISDLFALPDFVNPKLVSLALGAVLFGLFFYNRRDRIK